MLMTTRVLSTCWWLWRTFIYILALIVIWILPSRFASVFSLTNPSSSFSTSSPTASTTIDTTKTISTTITTPPQTQVVSKEGKDVGDDPFFGWFGFSPFWRSHCGGSRKRKTLILDLDETLVHSSPYSNIKFHYSINISLSSGKTNPVTSIENHHSPAPPSRSSTRVRTFSASDLSLSSPIKPASLLASKVNQRIQTKRHDILKQISDNFAGSGAAAGAGGGGESWCTFFVSERPHLQLFMKKVCEWYDVIIFTASLDSYANPVIDRLDPDRQIKARYFRETCVTIQDMFVKDLSKICDDLSQCIIVDNSPVSYALHPENALPVESWLGQNLRDRELLNILPLLEALVQLRDVRSVLRLRDPPHLSTTTTM